MFSAYCFCIFLTEAPRALHHVALSSYTTLYALDQVHTELELEEPMEQA
jgi:hypothetical protein